MNMWNIRLLKSFACIKCICSVLIALLIKIHLSVLTTTSWSFQTSQLSSLPFYGGPGFDFRSSLAKVLEVSDGFPQSLMAYTGIVPVSSFPIHHSEPCSHPTLLSYSWVSVVKQTKKHAVSCFTWPECICTEQRTVFWNVRSISVHTVSKRTLSWLSEIGR
jgi:hypothetical protein